MSGGKTWLRSSVTPQPLIHRWYAWPYLVAPHSGALNLRDRLVPIMRSYLSSPKLHADALANPARFGGPFIDPAPGSAADVEALLTATLRDGAVKLALADDIDALRALLQERADGGTLEALYAEVPDGLRGTVELVYDTAHRPAVRYFEPLLYRRPAYEPGSQAVSLTAVPDRRQPFVYGSPVLPRADRLDLNVEFSDPVLDDLFAARLGAVDAVELAERLGVAPEARGLWDGLFTSDEPPARHAAVEPGTVRIRYFGHACLLVETARSAILVDPLLGYTGDGHEHFTVADLPERLDAVVISHFHSDHFSLESLLQLRGRTDTIVVPRASGGTLQDPSLKTMLAATGFNRVHELGELESLHVGEESEITALPFIGEHADLDIRSKMVPAVRAAGRSFLFATDVTPVEPELYRVVRETMGPVDALYVGLECVGAPLSWLYGPLMESALPRRQDQSRRLKGSNAEQADRLARLVGAEHVYAYAMGLEPWLKHLTGSEFDAESEQVKQSALMVQACQSRGVGAELLYRSHERVWSAR